METWQKILYEPQKKELHKELFENKVNNIDFTEIDEEKLIIETFENLCEEIKLSGKIYMTNSLYKKALVVGSEKYYLDIKKNSIIIGLQNQKEYSFEVDRDGYRFNIGDSITITKPLKNDEREVIFLEESTEQYQFNYEAILNKILNSLVKYVHNRR